MSNQPAVLPWHREAAKEINRIHECGDWSAEVNPDTRIAQEIASHDPQGVWIAYDAWVKELEARLTAAKKRAELLQDHYECKMDTPQRVSRMEAQHAETLRLLERAAAELKWFSGDEKTEALLAEINTHIDAQRQTGGGK